MSGEAMSRPVKKDKKVALSSVKKDAWRKFKMDIYIPKRAEKSAHNKGATASKQRQVVMLSCKYGAPTAVPLKMEDGTIGMFYVTTATPSEHFPLDIPKGNNPRFICNKKIAKLSHQYATNHTFIANNGGIYVMVEDVSVVYDSENEILEFACDKSKGHGHNDGGHTLEGINSSVDKNGTNGMPVLLFIAEEAVFPTLEKRVRAAEAWNSRTPQAVQNEINVKGGFDFLKNLLRPAYLNNIQWAQNQVDSSGKTIPKENYASEVFVMLAAMIPEAYDSNYDVPWLMDLHRAGPSKVLKAIDAPNDNPGCYFVQSAEHANVILELACFIQQNIAASNKDYFITKKRSQTQLKKPLCERKDFEMRCFDGTTAKKAVPKELLLLIIRGLIHDKVQHSGVNKEFEFTSAGSTANLKALWVKKQDQVLTLISKIAEEKLAAEYNGRLQLFIKSDTVLRQVCKILQ